MNEFEKKYYEAPEFWKEGALDNELIYTRIAVTADLIPAEVKTLADIGCGNGLFGNYILRNKPAIDVLSIDRSEMALSFVKTNKKIGDINNIPLENSSHDCSTCLQVLEHIPVHAYQQALDELARVSKKYIIISVPYNEDLRQNATECPQCLSVFNADLHLRSYSDEAIARLFAERGFTCVATKNIVSGENYKGIELYYSFRKSLSPQKKVFASPICPICGFENKHFKDADTVNGTAVPQKSLLKKTFRTIIRPLKYIWPKKKVPGYWIIALYEKAGAIVPVLLTAAILNY